MHFIKNEKLYHTLILILSALIFFSFGLFHLAQFETTDEHLWKYDRTPQYWHALETHDWPATYINDKPGITVALFSGIGLLFEPQPENQYPDNYTPDKKFAQYDPQKTLGTNFTFRLPILVLATLSLFFFYYLLHNAFSPRIALLATTLLATNPILIGMSQIINPDSFFWIFGGLAICAHIALTQTQKKKFLWICGILTGFAFLSKYTAFTLFVFFALYEIGHILFDTKDITQKSLTKSMLIAATHIGTILIIALCTFILFLPAAFINPLLIFQGIAQFLTAKKILLGFLCFSIFGIGFFFGKKHIDNMFVFIRTKSRILLTVPILFFLMIIAFVTLNVWTEQHMIPFDDLRDAVYANEPQSFNFKPFLLEDTKIEKKIKAVFLNAYPLTFSLTPLILFTIIGGAIWSLRKKVPHNIQIYMFTLTSFFCIYYILTIIARVVTNVRYSIILYPLCIICTALIIYETMRHYALRSRFFYGTTIFILCVGTLLLWQLRPFYFSYTNMFLPQQFSIHDSWGHGSYEAAQYLNALPNANQLIIWSNSETVCRFFVGKCLRSRKIDLALVTPDYFVISKRGAIKDRNHFILENNSQPQKDSEYYFTHLHDLAVWMFYINDRPDNYVKIIPYEKP